MSSQPHALPSDGRHGRRSYRASRTDRLSRSNAAVGTSGLFITIDGPSGIGKTAVTQALRREIRTRQQPVIALHTPSDSAIGEIARHHTDEYRGRSLAYLVAADRLHLAETRIDPALARGTAVVCDRWLVSSLVLDLREGVPYRVMRTLYETLTTPTMAVVLLGDATTVEERLAVPRQRGRLHPRSAEDVAAEVVAYRGAATRLERAGYPVLRYEVGDRSAAEIAQSLASLVTKHEVDV